MSPEAEKALYTRLTWRIIPFLFLLYIVAFLDRVNIGYAKLQMAADLHFSDEIYGLGAGLFFIGYFLFEVPSNLILAKVGARIWIARILILWGLISSGFMFVQTPAQFYAMRFTLGVAEAGFFPGILLYLTCWFPSAYRARMVALFMTAVAVAGVVGGPLSGWVLRELSGVMTLAGWQWLFLIEGMPAVACGVLTLLLLKDNPDKAGWLDAEQKALVLQRLEEDRRASRDTGGHESFVQSLKDPKIWTLSLVLFGNAIGLYGINFFLPSLVKSMGVTDTFHNGLITAIPNAIAAVAMVLNGRHSDRTMERRWHSAVPALMSGVGLLVAAAVGKEQPVLAMAALTLGLASALAFVPVFWSLPTAFLCGSAAAGGIALVNSIGNLGGFSGPYLMGWVNDHLHTEMGGLYVLAGFTFLCAFLILGVFKPSRKGSAC